MTKLPGRKSRLMIETSDTVREKGKLREVIVEPDPQGYTVALRLKGLQTRYEISWGGIYALAVKLAVERARAEKRKNRGQRSR
jgi:hypothetical protein